MTFVVGTIDACTSGGASGATITITGAGSCTVTASQAGNDDYDAASPVSHTFTIAKAASATAVDCPDTVTYTGAAQEPCTATVTGAGGLNEALTVGYVDNTDAGTATASAAYAESADHLGSEDSTTFAIDQAALTVTAADQVRDYGEANPVFTGVLTGVQSGDDITATYASAATAASAVGTYAIVPTLVDPDGRLGNYTVAVVNGTLTVGQATLLVDAADQTKTYGDADPAATYTLSGFVNGENATSAEVTGIAECTYALHFENVATYTDVITCAPGTLSAANYGFATGTLGTLNITPRAITVTADPQTKIYGEADPQLTYAITSGELVGSDAFTGGLGRAAGENVGTYTIEQDTLTAGANYDLSYVGADLIISRKPVSGSFTAESRVYDSTTDATVTARSLDGAISGDDVSLDGGTAAFDTKNVGTGKTVTLAGAILAGTDSGNYTLTSVATTLSDITPRPLVVGAAGQNRAYDGTTAAAVTLSDNRVAGDSLTLGYTAASFADKNVGDDKPVSVSGISVAGADSGNYTFNATASTTADITTRAITVTAHNQQKVVGAPDPPLTHQVTIGSLVGGDTFTGALTRDPGEGIGSYAIRQGTLSLGSNYAITFVDGTLKIVYGFGGFLQPINYTAHSTGVQPDTSIFKAGSTVPVKFVLKDTDGNVLPCSGTATWLGYVKGGPTTGAVNEAVFTDPATGGGTYTCSNGTYHFNWSTKDSKPGISTGSASNWPTARPTTSTSASGSVPGTARVRRNGPMPAATPTT